MQTLQVLLIVVIAVGATTALKCYICDGHAVFGDKGSCGDTFDVSKSASLLQECNATAEERYCRKQKTGVNYVWNKVIRSCAKHCETDNSAVENIQCCETDECNVATAVTASLVSLVAMVTAVKYLLC